MHSKHILSALLAVGCLGALSGTTTAQERSPDHASTPEELDEIRFERDREWIHPGVPLDIVGLEQGDNGFRETTPALANDDLSVALLDPEENYRRRRAMYDTGATFDRAPRVVAHAKLALPKRPDDMRPVSRWGAVDPASPPQPLSMWPAIVLVALLVVLLVRSKGRRPEPAA